MPVRPAGSCVFAEEITYTKLVFVDCSAGRGNGVHRGKVSVLRQVMHRAMKHAFSRYRSALEGGVVVDIRELLIDPALLEVKQERHTAYQLVYVSRLCF
jgi:hypothetical protein